MDLKDSRTSWWLISPVARPLPTKTTDIKEMWTDIHASSGLETAILLFEWVKISCLGSSPIGRVFVFAHSSCVVRTWQQKVCWFSLWCLSNTHCSWSTCQGRWLTYCHLAATAKFISFLNLPYTVFLISDLNVIPWGKKLSSPQPESC
jgi:hypothetical protein